MAASSADLPAGTSAESPAAENPAAENRAATLVVSIEGLRAAALGAYGQTAYETPALDALAADSLVYDWAYAASADRNEPLGETIARLARRDQRLDLLATDSDPSAFDAPASVTRRISPPSPTDVAESLEQTSQAAVWLDFGEALVELAATRDRATPLVAWFHTRGLCGPWDAPAEWVDAMRDAEDDPPVETTAEPAEAHHESRDTAEAEEARFAASCRYAAQVRVLDACLAEWLDLATGLFADEPLRIVLFGAGGYALGEHAAIGSDPGSLFSETRHTPLLVHESWSDEHRFARLAEPTALASAVAGIVAGGLDAPNGAPLVLRSGAAAAVRTGDWFLRHPEADAMPELYLKPDDRWEQNDVASREPAVADELLATLRDAIDSDPRTA